MNENKTQMYEHFRRQGEQFLEETPPGGDSYTKRREMSNQYKAFHCKKPEKTRSKLKWKQEEGNDKV